MAYGIYTQPVGPGPAAPAPLFIDSGSTFPQYLGTINSFVSFSGGSANVAIPGWDGTGSLVVVPIKPIVWEDYIPPDLTSFIVALTGITPTSNTNCRLNISVNLNRAYQIGLNFYKVWPQDNQSYGITFSNSANYFSINDSGVVGQCVWAWEGTINGALQIPNISGFDMSKAIVFANWSNTSAGLAYDYDSRQVRVYQNRSNFSGSNQTGSIAGVKVAVFCNGTSGVPVHNGGLNIYSPNGQQCVFSTYKSPFMYKRSFPASGGSTGLTYPMVCLTTSVGAISGGSQGGWYWQHMRAHYMNGGSITTGYGPFVYSWTDEYDLRYNGVVNFSLPLLDAQDYFASI